MESDTYLTIKSISQGLYRDKGSRFISFAYPVFNQDEIKPIIEKVRKEYHDARHHCYAWMLGAERESSRVNDDGEPSGTAGRPILGQINSHGLTNILIVVVRYFGGKLLGVSGLINAYRSAAESAITNAEIGEFTVKDFYRITFPYSSLNEVMRIIKEEEIDQGRHLFDLTCSLEINFRVTASDRILKLLSRIEDLEVIYTGRH
jgi:uncharacterized YigZ family protein